MKKEIIFMITISILLIFFIDFVIGSIYTIQEDDIITDSLLKNITAETKFTHLNISDNAPYDSLVGYWSFDGDNLNISYDFSKYNNNGEGLGFDGDEIVDGKYGNAFRGTGGDDRINISNAIGSGVITTKATWSFWLNLSDYTCNAFITKRDAYNSNNQFGIGFNFDQEVINFEFSIDGTTNNAFWWNKENITLNNWHHLAFIYDNNTINNVKLFIDSVERIPHQTANLNGSLFQSTSDLYIGAVNNGGACEIDGTIDEVMIFNTSLNPSQISDIYNNQSARFRTEGTQKVRAVKVTNETTWNNGGDNRVNLTVNYQNNMESNIFARIGQINMNVNNSGLVLYIPFEWGSAVDISGEGNDGNFFNDAFINENGLNDTRGAQFDGTDDYINLSNEITNGFSEVTFSAWFKTTNNGAQQMIVNNFVDDGSDGQALYARLGSGMLRFLITTETGKTALDYTVSITENQWYHWVGTYNGTNMTSYLNGVNVLSIGKTGTLVQTTYSMLIGARAGSGALDFYGSIDEVMIWNRTLSAVEALALYKNQSGTKNIAYYTDYQNLTGTHNEFTINTDADFIFPDFRFYAGNFSHPFYTPILNGSITLETWSSGADVCDCPSSGSNWDINDGSICKPTSNCNIGTGKLRITDGGLLIDSGINIRAGGCFVKDGEKLYIEDGGGLYCGS